MTAEGQACTSLLRAHPNPKPRTFRQPRCHAPQLDLTIAGRRNGDFLRWPGWPSRLIDHIAVAGLESYGSSARNTYTGYACEGSIHLSDKVPNLARRTGMPAAPLIVHKIMHCPTTQHHRKQTKLCTDLDHAITTCCSSARASTQSHDLRRGWGLRHEMRIALQREAHPIPHYHCAKTMTDVAMRKAEHRTTTWTRDSALFQGPGVPRAPPPPRNF